MGIDVENFGLGVLVGWGTAYGVYRARHAIQAARDSAKKGAVTLQNSATRSNAKRCVLPGSSGG